MVALWNPSGRALRRSTETRLALTLRARSTGKGLVFLVLVGQFLALIALVTLTPGPVAWPAVVATVALLVMYMEGALGTQVGLSALDRLPGVLTAFALATGTIAAGLSWLHEDQVALAMLRFGPVAALVSWSTLAATYAIGRAARAHGWFMDRAVVVGSGRVADRLDLALAQRPEYGLELVGFVTPSPQDAPPSQYLGQPDELLSACIREDAYVVIVAYSRDSESAMLGPIRQCIASGRRVLVVPRFFEDLDRHQVGNGVWGVPLQALPMPNAGHARRFAKRALDVTLASAAFVFLLPVMAISALAIRWETGGVLFRQVRVGRDELPIEILKFQTLKPQTVAESDTTWNVSTDSRLGPVGRFLRRTSIDELPQLWNVIRGDMSLVGPRPERPYFVEQFKESVPGYSGRHRVQVGLTGWAQVHQLRGDTSIEERARFDNAYVASWSPWEDVKIILRTLPEVFRRSGG